MLIVICGPRNWADDNYVRVVLNDLNVRGKVDSLFVGDATGVDAIAAKWAESKGIHCKVFRADWSTGRGAGIARSARMLAAVGPNALVVALAPAGGALTTGTGHTVRMAIDRGMSLRVESPDGRAWQSDWPDQPDAFRRLHILVAEFEVSL